MSAAGEAWRVVAWLAPLIAAAAAALTAGLILALRPWLSRYALARPNARTSHREPTPQWGGLAVVAATVAVVLAVAPVARSSDRRGRMALARRWRRCWRRRWCWRSSAPPTTIGVCRSACGWRC